MSKHIHICTHCGEQFERNPRVKKQRYCGKRACRKARRATWQRRKMTQDLDYRDNQKMCQKEWQKRHDGYYRRYRKAHPEYTRRNRLLQQMRNARNRKTNQDKMIAKMDSLLKPHYSRRGSIFKLIPQGNGMIAKMDSLLVKLVPV